MTTRLSPEEVARYRRDGVLFPIRCFSEAATARYARLHAGAERRDGGRLLKRHNEKPHLLMRWLSDLIRDPAILDPVEDLIGPNILAWQSGFFAKHPGDGGYVSWHQDSTYWGLSPPDVVTAWIAFTQSNEENGCMRVIPGSHARDQLPHADTFAASNMLSRGQEISVAVDESQAVSVVLKPGEMSLHHVRMVHGSKANTGDVSRVGFTVRYLPTYVRQVSGARDSATLVRGVDQFGHFELEPAPQSDFDSAAVGYHTHMLESQAQLRYAGAARGPAYETIPVQDERTSG